MTLRLAKKLQTIFTLVLAVLALLFLFIRLIPILFLFVVFLFALVILRRVYLRCPHCGRSLSRGHAEYCTYCGKWVDPETTF